MPTEKDFDYFFDNLERFRKQHMGYYVLIKNSTVCAVYHDERAVEANALKYGPEVLIMHIDEEKVQEYKLKNPAPWPEGSFTKNI